MGLSRRLVATLILAFSLVTLSTVPVQDLVPEPVIDTVGQLVPDQVSELASLAVPDFVKAAVGTETASAWGFNFCHAAAMAAVYTIGAAAFALLAASGGGMVAGVWISSSAASGMAAALTAGAGLSALVSVYIC